MNISKDYADRIAKVLEYLKDHKISQYEIEERLNYTSLSKAKNFERYPQHIIEKFSRKELLDRILLEYGLVYNESNGEISPSGTEIIKQKDEEDQYYIMYYFAFARDTVGRAIVRIINQKHAVIDYRFDEHWEGNYEIIENYTFISVEKQGEATPVKKLICLFTGTKKSGRPYLFGTYSTVKRDGIPAAGKVLFERIEKDQIEGNLKSIVDPRITYYLLNKVYVTDTFTPNSLDDVTTTFRQIKRFANKYFLFYPLPNKELIKCELICTEDSRASLSIKDLCYTGFLKPVDIKTIRIELSANPGFSNIYSDNIVLFASTSKTQFDPFYFCVGISNTLETSNNSFVCLLIEEDVYDTSEQAVLDEMLTTINEHNSGVKFR